MELARLLRRSHTIPNSEPPNPLDYNVSSTKRPRGNPVLRTDILQKVLCVLFECPGQTQNELSTGRQKNNKF